MLKFILWQKKRDCCNILCAVFEENYCTTGQRTYSEYAILQFKKHFEYPSHRERLFVLFH